MRSAAAQEAERLLDEARAEAARTARASDQETERLLLARREQLARVHSQEQEQAQGGERAGVSSRHGR